MAPSNSRSSTPATADATASRSSDPVGDDDDGAAREEEELRRGPWTVDEDLALVNYITGHGEGRWNSLAQAAGLKRTGKSCRLRWLNYLRPDVKRGNFTADEQLLILDLHSRYGNRWSKIAQHLPGRTDNEIKNYWRTRVQKHAKQLNCDANSKRFKDAMRYLWMPHQQLVDDVDVDGADRHRGLLLHAAAVEPHQRQQPSSAGVDDQDGGCCYYYYDGATAAMSGVGVTSSSTSDSFATAASESYSHDAVPKNKWDPPPPSSSYDVVDAAALYYADDDDVRLGGGVEEQALLLNGGGGDWVVQEMINQQQGQLQLWPPEQQKAAPAVQVVSNASGAATQFELDAELSGWVQSFSNAENFWTFEDI